MKPQLSHTYTPGTTLEGVWAMSEKYDGIRALWSGSKLTTRSGRGFTWVPQWFLDSLPQGVPLDGELIIPGKPFNEIASITVQKECEEAVSRWKQVIYKIFDSPHPTKIWDYRIDSLKGVLRKPCELVKFIKINKIVSKITPETYFREITQRGGEGIMLIRTDSLYQPKRVRHSLKYKRNYEGEALVIALCEGRGKYKGFLGKLKCQLPNGGTFYCGTGFDDELRKSYKFSNEECIKSVSPNIGDMITYCCMELNPNGIPRMSVYKAVRTDLF